MADLRDSRSVCARRQMSCVKLTSFCGKSSKRTGRQTRQDRASQHNGHRAEHGLHERCCARVRGVARVVRDMPAVESGVRRSRRCRAWSDPAPSPAGAAQSPAAAAAASERPKRAAGQGACTVVGSIVGATSNNDTTSRPSYRTGNLNTLFSTVLARGRLTVLEKNHRVYGFHRI